MPLNAEEQQQVKDRIKLLTDTINFTKLTDKQKNEHRGFIHGLNWVLDYFSESKGGEVDGV